MTADEILELERLSCRAWPALNEFDVDGWLVRTAGGFTGRANSVHPLADGRMPAAERVAGCEAAYRAAGLPPVFKTTPASRPAGVEAALSAAGYTPEHGALVMTADLAAVPTCDGPEVVLHRDADAGWITAFADFTAVPERHQPVLQRIVTGTRVPYALGEVRVDGRPAAVGRAVAEDGWVGLFEVATRADARRRGLGRRVVTTLLNWGRRAGATRAYLQVVGTNAPAIALYRQLGFEAAYEYRYWRRRHLDVGV